MVRLIDLLRKPLVLGCPSLSLFPKEQPPIFLANGVLSSQYPCTTRNYWDMVISMFRLLWITSENATLPHKTGFPDVALMCWLKSPVARMLSLPPSSNLAEFQPRGFDSDLQPLCRLNSFVTVLL